MPSKLAFGSVSESSNEAQQVENVEEESVNRTSPSIPPEKKNGTNTPWTPIEEQRLESMRDAGNSWDEIAKVIGEEHH